MGNQWEGHYRFFFTYSWKAEMAKAASCPESMVYPLHRGATLLEVTAKPSLPSPLCLDTTVGLVLTDGMRTEVLYITLGQCV